MDSVEGLSSFDVVIRVGCNQINDRDINLFYERLFPTSFSFTNTNSFKKSLDEYKVFWIMDGFDESTAEFKGFLTAMTDSLSEKHKLLITTRPHTYEDLKGHLGELSITSLTLELLQDRNVEEIIQSLITEDEKKETFKIHFHNLDETAKDLLRTPLHLDLFIKLWILNPELVHDTYTTKMLYLKTISNNLSLLQERLVGRTCWSSEDLKGYVKDWFYGSLCKQSFLMVMQYRLNIIEKEDLDTLRKDARHSKLDPSSCLSAFLVKGKKNYWEDEGEFRYEFHHLTQQYILASLFFKHFKDYDGENVINTISTELLMLRPLRRLNYLINFYVEMSFEDGSLDNDCTQVFYHIQYIINRVADIDDKSELWFTTSVASKFNVKYMEKVSQAFKDIPSLYIDCSEFNFNDSLELTNLKKFLKFVRLQNIVLSHFIFEYIQEEYFQPLLEFLINSKLEIEIQKLKCDYPSFESDDSFCGTIDSFFHPLRNDRKNWTEKLKTMCIKVNYKYKLKTIFFEKLKELKALERLEIRIIIGFIWLPIPSNISNIPNEMVEITTIGLINLNIDNFGMVLEKLNKIKGEGSLKFKALYHDFEDISETDKRQLQKIAHTVSIDFICQCQKDLIAKIDKLNITSFKGDLQVLNALNAHHANLKSVFLCIFYEREFHRTLKFLHDYKANLDEVKINLNISFPELVNLEIRTSSNAFFLFLNWIRTFCDKNRTSSNVLAIPQELVQRTSIFIPNVNEDNFHNYFTLLNNLSGEGTMKFKAVYTDHRRLSPHQLEMLNQIAGNSSCIKDFLLY